MSLSSRVVVFTACGVLGYFVAHAVIPRESSTVQRTAGPIPDIASTEPLVGDPARSAMVAEWKSLRAQHGGETPDWDALYQSIKDTKDPYRRRAYRAALIADWAEKDPQAALVYLLEKDGSMVSQMMREWMRTDPHAALNGILAAGPKGRNALRGLQSDVATLLPHRLAEIVSALPKSDNRWDTSTQTAFTRLAKTDPLAAKAAAEAVTGPMKGQALTGVAAVLAENDGAGALTWAEAIPPGDLRNAALRGVLIGWARKDPVAALSRIDLVPPGGEEMSFGSDIGSQVLREAAGSDWEATIQWLTDNPGKLGQASIHGLQGAFSQRLIRDPAATLRELTTTQFPGLLNVFGSAVINDGYATRDAVWSWLEGQPPSTTTQAIRQSLLSAIAWKEPYVALEFLDKIPDTPENAALLRQSGMSLLNGGERAELLESLLEKASAKIRPHLLEGAFNFAEGFMGREPQKWVQRLNELPEQQRQSAAQGLARAWAVTDPTAAAEWSLTLPDGQKPLALRSAVSTWAQSEPQDAAAWINQQPKDLARDAATQSLVGVLAVSTPDSAWTWAMSIEDPSSRLQSLGYVYQRVRGKSPEAAEQLLQDPSLSPELVKAVREAPATPGMHPVGTVIYRF